MTRSLLARSSALLGVALVAGAFASGCGDDGSGGGGDGAVRGTWRVVASGTTSELRGVWGASANNVFAIAPDAIRKYNGTAWVAGPDLGLTAEGMNGPVPAFNLTAIGGADAANFFVAGTSVPEDGSGEAGINRMLRVQGARYNALMPDMATTMVSIWARNAGEVWAVGGSRVLRSDGMTWSRFSAGGLDGADLYGVWAASADDAYVVGDRIYHLTGGNWEAADLGAGSSYYFAVWGSAANNVWAVGASRARRWNGTTWEGVLTGTTQSLRGIWGSAPNDIWAVGDGGTIVHYNGSAWSTVPSGTTNNLRAVYGLAANDIWAVGAGGTILHYTY